MCDLSQVSTEDLLAEIAKRRAAQRRCECGPKRTPIQDKRYDLKRKEWYVARTGCLECDLWDGPLVIP